MSQPIRNFCIIAHIDHGKSTLADRLIEITGAMQKRDMREQTLDTMDIEQERGITIKLTPVRMEWKGVELNLIDTPGHVDFQYEVSRSLASVEGAILVVDATQGIEAQTLSNVYLALENDLAIIPVLNKIDLPSADVERVTNEVVSLLGCDPSEIISVSAKTGENVETILDAVLERFPEPKRLDAESGLVAHASVDAEAGAVKALVFDSQYDTYKGVVIYVKLFSGAIKKGDPLELIHSGSKLEALEVGCFRPKYDPIGIINEGEIGYVVTGLKTVAEARMGDTLFRGPIDKKIPIEGFKKITPFVFAGVYPVDTDEYPKLKDSLDKLSLNDSSLSIENEVSPALGHGFRCGFLGLLHLDIVKERLWREFEMDVIMTSPQVTYRVVIAGDKVADYPRNRPELVEFTGKTCTQVYVSNPEDLPKPGNFIHIEEPISKIEIITPTEYVGGLMQLCQERRGKFTAQHYLDAKRVVMTYEIPMAELVGDFYDDLKSISSGYGSLSYEFLRYQMDDLHRLDILVAGERVDAFSMIVHAERARTLGGNICRKLKEHIPKAQFAISIQAALGNQVIAREDISALRKDVTAKLYGGDISRKRKLLEKQKEGKKKMKQFGKVSIPSETFVNILKK
jgi:GTP-binding protein LepA